MITYITIFCYLTTLITCYQRPNHNSNTNNHGNDKPTHIPHSPFGHKWTEPYFDLQMPRNVTSLVGKSAYLGCRVRNLGNKTVAWIRHRDLHILTVGTYTYTTDQRFQTSFHRDIEEWTLQIKWAQQRDAGAYECQISTQPVRAFSVNLNIVESIISETDSLLQQYYSDDDFYISPDRFYQRGRDEFAGLFPMKTIAVPSATILGGPDLYVDKGSTINLTCAIKFSPEPPTHIFWYHQDKVLSEDSERGGISFVSSKEDSSKSILLIENADLPDSGKYSCFPSNTEIASIRVHVLNGERPEAMQTSGAARSTSSFFGYHSSLIALSPVSVSTVTSVLATLCTATTIFHILMAGILIKFFQQFFQHFRAAIIMNSTRSESSNAKQSTDTAITAGAAFAIPYNTDENNNASSKNSSKMNNCMVNDEASDKNNNRSAIVIAANFQHNTITLNDSNECCINILHHKHSNHQNYIQHECHKYGNRISKCQLYQQQQQQQQNYQFNHYRCASLMRLIQQICFYDDVENKCCVCSKCCTHFNCIKGERNFSISGSNKCKPNQATIDCMHQQLRQRQHYQRGQQIVVDEATAMCNNSNQLRTNSFVKSSFHNLCASKLLYNRGSSDSNNSNNNWKSSNNNSKVDDDKIKCQRCIVWNKYYCCCCCAENCISQTPCRMMHEVLSSRYFER